MTPITLNVIVGYGVVILTFFAGLKYINRVLHNVFDEGRMVLKPSSSVPSIVAETPKDIVENG